MEIDGLKSKVKKITKERNWEPFHNSKNLVMAILLGAAEFIESF